MGIEKITNKVTQTIQGISARGKEVAHKVVDPTIDVLKNGTKKITGTLDALAQNAKAGVQKWNSGDLQSYAKGSNFRLQSLVYDGMASGLTKKQAEKGARTVVYATGEFAHKSAAKSAEVLKNAPTPQSVLKEELLQKFHK